MYGQIDGEQDWRSQHPTHTLPPSLPSPVVDRSTGELTHPGFIFQPNLCSICSIRSRRRRKWLKLLENGSLVTFAQEPLRTFPLCFKRKVEFHLDGKCEYDGDDLEIGLFKFDDFCRSSSDLCSLYNGYILFLKQQTINFQL